MDAIGLAVPHSHFENQVALCWNFVADPGETGCYDFALGTSGQSWLTDLRPMVREATMDLVDGRSPAVVSARFHNPGRVGVGRVEKIVEVTAGTELHCGDEPRARPGR